MVCFQSYLYTYAYSVLENRTRMRVGCGCRYEYEEGRQKKGGPVMTGGLQWWWCLRKMVAIWAMGSEKWSKKEVLKEGQVPDQH